MKRSWSTFVAVFLGVCASSASARVRLNVSGMTFGQVVIAILVAALAIAVVSTPGKVLGRALISQGQIEGKKWKIDLGEAIIRHSFYLFVALVGLGLLLFGA